MHRVWGFLKGLCCGIALISTLLLMLFGGGCIKHLKELVFGGDQKDYSKWIGMGAIADIAAQSMLAIIVEIVILIAIGATAWIGVEGFEKLKERAQSRKSFKRRNRLI